MRKIIMVSVMVFISIGVVYATPIGFEAEMEIGLADGGFGKWTRDKEDNNNSFNTDYTGFRTTYIRIGGYIWLFEHFYIGGDSTVQMVMRRMMFETGMDSVHDVIPEYNPKFTNYHFEAGITLFDIMTLFVSHDCAHPQNTYQYDYKVTSVWGEGSVTRVGVKFSVEMDGVGNR